MRCHVAAAVLLFLGGAVVASGPTPLPLGERIAAQRAIEEVYWRHRIWPAANPGPKPGLAEVLPETALRARVDDYLRKSAALEQRYRRPITASDLQGELDRMAARTRDPRLLRELFAALGDDPFVIAETLARQTLADRLLRDLYARDARRDGEPDDGTVRRATAIRPGASFDTWWSARRDAFSPEVEATSDPYVLPSVDTGGCVSDTWTVVGPPPGGGQTAPAVWTGAEMVVWGGHDLQEGDYVNTGGRYIPATDTWTTTSTGENVPAGRHGHAAVWTGTEMIIWGGQLFNTALSNTGGRYSPAADTWEPTSIGGGVPDGRDLHTAVWTGTEMIVWGGIGPGSARVNTGGRYDPEQDTWSETATGANVPDARDGHTAVWTGEVMIVWGGIGGGALGSGGRYDPATDLWSETSTGANSPGARTSHAAVWTGAEMIVWGGNGNAGTLGAGRRYHPSTDTWAPTSEVSVPQARFFHTAVWTGLEMIVWGGQDEEGQDLNTGGRFDPVADQWAPTSVLANVPEARHFHQTVWTGAEMIIQGGTRGLGYPPSGGRYCACPDGEIYYRDADGDGHGDPGASTPSCDGAIPAGHVAGGTDCDDGNASVHPGAAEVCNGADDDCDGVADEGIPAPSGTRVLYVDGSDTDAVLVWSSVGGATGYDVIRGELLVLRMSGGDFTVATSACLADDTVLQVYEQSLPSPGDGKWFLVRAVNACGGNGTYDEGSASQQGGRDAEIEAAPGSCP